MSTDWITWALQGLLALLVIRVWTQLDKNTEALTELRVDLPTNYISKTEFEKLEEYTRERIHELANIESARVLREAARK